MWCLIPCFIYAILFLISSSAFGKSCNRGIALTQIIVGIMLITINMCMTYYFIYDTYVYPNNVIETNVYISYITVFFQTLMCNAHIYDSDISVILKDIRLCRDRAFILLRTDHKKRYSYGQFDNPKSYIAINSIPTLIFTIVLYYDAEFYFAYIMIIRLILTIIYVKI